MPSAPSNHLVIGNQFSVIRPAHPPLILEMKTDYWAGWGGRVHWADAEVAMGSFQGGSAPAMARQICDGFTLVSQVSLKRLSLEQMTSLEFELDKRLRETRGEPVDLEDQPSLQARNRRISRIESAMRVLRHTIQQRRAGRI